MAELIGALILSLAITWGVAKYVQSGYDKFQTEAEAEPPETDPPG